MVKEIIILRESGIPLFHYSVSGEKRLDEIVAGFLSAMGGFVEQISDQQIKVVAFAKSKFVWEKKGDLYFIALVSREDSAEIYRAILQNLSDSFVSKYYNVLRKEIISPKEFFPFTDTVELTLQKFDGIPGLARRYKTGLLPLAILRSLKVALAEVESKPEVKRGALLTNDGYILVSNFRAYEMEAMLDQMKSTDFEKEVSQPRLVVHTSLEPVTSFYIHPLPRKRVAVFVVQASKENEYYSNLVQQFLTVAETSSFDEMKKIHPAKREESTGFYEYDVIQPNAPLTKIINDAKEVFSEMTAKTQENVITILKAIDGKRTIFDIEEKTNLGKESITEAIAGLITNGLVHITQLYPVMGDRDDRFAAYLEVIGIPKRDYDIVDIVWNYCTGGYSIREISEKTEIQATRVVDVLRALGNYVDWQNERRLEHDRPNN